MKSPWIKSVLRVALEIAGAIVCASILTSCPNPTEPGVETGPRTVTTLAGMPPGDADGTGSEARFYQPWGVAVLGTSLYVTDVGNFTIRKIDISTRTVTTVAGHAGSGGHVDGTGSSARFGMCEFPATDGTDIYVAEYGSGTIRKVVVSTGEVTTIAGLAGFHGSADGTGSAARFNGPGGVASDGANLFVADKGNNTIRKIVISTGEVTTIAGLAGSSGCVDGVGSTARFNCPDGVASNGANLFVADTGNNTIRKVVISTGEVTTIAGLAGSSGSVDGVGSAARFLSPLGIASDGSNLYVTDNGTVRKVVISTREVTTIAGLASFYWLNGIATDGTSLFIADSENNTILLHSLSTLQVSTLAGSASIGSSDGIGSAARFYSPCGIAANSTDLFVADSGNYTIRKIVLSTGEVSTLAGLAGASGIDDGTGSAARFLGTSFIAIDGDNLYVSDSGYYAAIRKIVISTGEVTTIARSYELNSPSGIATDGTQIYVASYINNSVYKVLIATGEIILLAGSSSGEQGSADGTGSAARFSSPGGIVLSGSNLYVPDTLNHVIRRIAVGTGEVSTIAGLAGSEGHADGIGTSASFSYPSGLATDGESLFVTDTANYVIRQIVISTGLVATIAGGYPCPGWQDGLGTAARFRSPRGIAWDGTRLYVSDDVCNTIRMLQ